MPLPDVVKSYRIAASQLSVLRCTPAPPQGAIKPFVVARVALQIAKR